MDDAPLPARAAVPAAEYASCCLTVTGNLRCCFVLPREVSTAGEAVRLEDVWTELRDGPMRSVIPPGKGNFAIKRVQRNYAFELANVPRHKADYLKLVYSATFPPLPAGLSGRTFSHVFGAQTSCMETFLLKRRLQGPCWLRVAGARNSERPVSHCAFDITLDGPKGLTVYGEMPAPKPNAAPGVPPPPAAGPLQRVVEREFRLALPVPELKVAALSLKTVLTPRSHQHEIVVASLGVHSAVSQDGQSNERRSAVQALTIVRPLTGTGGLPADFRTAIARNPAIKPMPDERSLLNLLLAQLARIDPDVIVGHNITGFDLDVLLHRLQFHRTPNWSRIGRLRRTAMPRVGQGVGGRDQFTGQLTPGRLVCDTYLAARELVRETTYALGALAQSMLGEQRADIEPMEVPRLLEKGADCLRLCQHAENDAWLALRLMFKLQVLPLTKQLTNVAGNLWSRSLRGARAERIEYLLLHDFHRLKYIVPDKERAAWGRAAAAAEEADEDEDEDEAAAGAGAAAGAAKKGGAGKRAVTGSGTAARHAKGRAKPAYSGGLVLEPKRGLYDKFVLLRKYHRQDPPTALFSHHRPPTHPPTHPPTQLTQAP